MIQSHYVVAPLQEGEKEKLFETFRDVEEKDTWNMNWLFFGTSGVHGSRGSLDDIEEHWDEMMAYDVDPEDEDYDPPYSNRLTILFVKPRTCVMVYGNIEVELDEIPILRRWCDKTLEGIKGSQRGNYND